MKLIFVFTLSVLSPAMGHASNVSRSDFAGGSAVHAAGLDPLRLSPELTRAHLFSATFKDIPSMITRESMMIWSALASASGCADYKSYLAGVGDSQDELLKRIVDRGISVPSELTVPVMFHVDRSGEQALELSPFGHRDGVIASPGFCRDVPVRKFLREAVSDVRVNMAVDSLILRRERSEITRLFNIASQPKHGTGFSGAMLCGQLVVSSLDAERDGSGSATVTLNATRIRIAERCITAPGEIPRPEGYLATAILDGDAVIWGKELIEPGEDFHLRNRFAPFE